MARSSEARHVAKLAIQLVEMVDDWAVVERPRQLVTHYEENRVPLTVVRWVAAEIVALKDSKTLALEPVLDELKKVAEATAKLREVCNDSMTRDAEYPEARREFEVAVGGLVIHGGIWAAMRGFLSLDHRAPIATIKAAKQARDECGEHAKQTKTILEKARQEARDLFTKEGADLFAEEFEGYAVDQRRASDRWLGGAIGLFVLTILVALVFLLLPWPAALEDLLGPNNLGKLTGKIAILSLLTYATTWCGRMSQVLRHAATVNEHRANSAKALLAFRKGASDEETKNRILAEATKAVFQNIQTGYLGKVEGPPGAALLGGQPTK